MAECDTNCDENQQKMFQNNPNMIHAETVNVCYIYYRQEDNNRNKQNLL